MLGPLAAKPSPPSYTENIRPLQQQSNGRYGWLTWTPKRMQFLVRPLWALVLFCLLALTQGAQVNGLVHFFLPHIERRFDLNSTESSFIINAYDLASLLFLIPVTYLGSRKGSHRPRIIGHGAIIMGTGSLIFSLPAFLTGPYNGEVMTYLCNLNFEIPTSVKESIHSYWFLYALLFIGNFLHGIGGSPLFTLCITYIDDGIPQERSSLYLGAYYSMTLLGPAFGIALGGIIGKNIHVDFLRNIDIPQEDVLTPDSPRWVGCWWLGVILVGLLFFPIGALILGLPQSLPGAEALAIIKAKTSQGTQSGPTRTIPELVGIRDLPPTLYLIVSDPRFDLITLAACCEGVILTGMGAHFPKVLEQQFALDQAWISVGVALVAIPPSLIGMAIGACIIKYLNLQFSGMLKLCMLMMALGSAFAPVFLLHCESVTYSRIKTEKRFAAFEAKSLIEECNSQCHCDGSNFAPVCSHDQESFFSPCYAGCLRESYENSTKYFYDCLCINGTYPGLKYQAMLGTCRTFCYQFAVFLSLVFVYQTITFTACIPGLTATLRCIDKEGRSFGLAIQWLCLRLFGAIPGPIIFGQLLDRACVYWHKIDELNTGTCYIYNHKRISLYITLLCACLKVTQFGLFFATWLLEKWAVEVRLKRGLSSTDEL